MFELFFCVLIFAIVFVPLIGFGLYLDWHDREDS